MRGLRSPRGAVLAPVPEGPLSVVPASTLRFLAGRCVPKPEKPIACIMAADSMSSSSDDRCISVILAGCYGER